MNIGRLTIYPRESAMHGAINIRTRRWGYVCIGLPMYSCGRWWPWFFYLSPNATPWAATLIVGPAHWRTEKMLARLRRVLWGHGYSTEDHNPQDAMAYSDVYEGHLPGSYADMLFARIIKGAENLTPDQMRQMADYLRELAALEEKGSSRVVARFFSETGEEQ